MHVLEAYHHVFVYCVYHVGRCKLSAKLPALKRSAVLSLRATFSKTQVDFRRIGFAIVKLGYF